jgi:dienelactone hydrolase
MRLPRILLAAAAATLALAAPAAANIPTTSVLTLPVTVPSMGGYSVGSALMTVKYTDSTATATVTAPSVLVGNGHYFRIVACLKRHVINNSYDSKCSQSFVDTRSKTAAITIAAPTVSLTSPRPGSSSSSGYFAYTVNVDQRQDGGTYSTVASSWPNSLAKASLAIAPKGLTSGQTPTSEGVALSTNLQGGMNTSQPDSFCGADSHGLDSPAPSDLNTTELGSAAPAYYEVGEPTGAYAGQAPKGVMLLIHGGGWYSVGAHFVQGMRPEADFWRARGWRTLNITYHSCAASFADVQAFYDAARAAWGTAMPYCASGQSAGGQLALLLAASRPTVNCVISEAGPTDMVSLKSQPVNVSDPVAASDGGKEVYNMMAAAFGGDDQAIWWSPAQWKINARVLWAVGDGDPLIPPAQGDLLRTKMLANDPNAYIDVEHLAAGSSWFVHTGVSQDALDSFHAAEDQLVAPLVG